MNILKHIICFIFILALIFPQAILASELRLNLTYPVPLGAPNINEEEGQSLIGIIAWFYYFMIWISGLAAFVMIVWGGVQHFTSAGNPAKMADAWDRIKNAVLGLLIIFTSFLILQVISPQFTILTKPEI